MLTDVWIWNLYDASVSESENTYFPSSWNREITSAKKVWIRSILILTILPVRFFLSFCFDREDKSNIRDSFHTSSKHLCSISRSLVCGLRSTLESSGWGGGERGLLSRTAAGYRAYQTPRISNFRSAAMIFSVSSRLLEIPMKHCLSSLISIIQTL